MVCATNLINNSSFTSLTYTLADAALSQVYQIDQTPDCGYTETVTLSPEYSWISINSNKDQINIDYLTTSYSSLIGVYAMKLTKTIQMPVDVAQTAFVDVSLEMDFDVTILQGTPVNVCPTYSDWYYVQNCDAADGYSCYTDTEGFASPDDDASQYWRKRIIDDE